MIIAAIDPGLTGAIAIFNMNKNECTVFIHKMPTHIVSLNNLDNNAKRSVHTLSVHVLKELIQEVDYIIIEKIVPYAKDSRVSCFSFGGAFHSMLSSFHYLHKVYEVDPKQWKKSFSLMNTDKDCVVERAMETSKQLQGVFNLEVLPTTKHTRIAFCDAYLIGIHYLKSIGFLTLNETVKKQLVV